MPSFPYTPGALALSGGSFFPEPIRFEYIAGALTLTGAAIDAAPNYTMVTQDIAAIKLNRLQRGLKVVEDSGAPTERFQLNWQRSMEAIERALISLSNQVTDLSSIVAQIQAAQATATQAAQDVATVSARIDLANSYTTPVDGNLTASSVGVITVAAHSRTYDNGATVSVNGGSVSGFTEGQFIRVYYTDAAREGGAVTYMGTTDEITQSGDIHVVGGVTIPAAGQPDATGAGSTPPGYVYDYTQDYR